MEDLQDDPKGEIIEKPMVFQYVYSKVSVSLETSSEKYSPASLPNSTYLVSRKPSKPNLPQLPQCFTPNLPQLIQKKISRPKLPQHPLAAPNLNVPQPRSSRRLCAITFLRTSGLHVNGTNFWGVALFRSGPGRPIVENKTRRTIEPSVLYRLRATQKSVLLGCRVVSKRAWEAHR